MKILIVLDTNVINTSDYKRGFLGGDFIRITDYIRNNKLTDCINLAITDTTIREIYRHKRDQYRRDRTSFETAHDTLYRTPNHVTDVKFPVGIDYEKSILQDLRNEISKHPFIKTPVLSESKKIMAFNSIIENCDADQTRLNDQIIIEEIKYYKYLNNYSSLILYTTNRKDFEDYLPDNIQLLTSWEELKSTLDTIFLVSETDEEARFKDFLQTEYAKDLITQAYEESMGGILTVEEINTPEFIIDDDIDPFFIVHISGRDMKFGTNVEGNFIFDTTNTIINVDITYQ